MINLFKRFIAKRGIQASKIGTIVLFGALLIILFGIFGLLADIFVDNFVSRQVCYNLWLYLPLVVFVGILFRIIRLFSKTMGYIAGLAGIILVGIACWYHAYAVAPFIANGIETQVLNLEMKTGQLIQSDFIKTLRILYKNDKVMQDSLAAEVDFILKTSGREAADIYARQQIKAYKQIHGYTVGTEKIINDEPIDNGQQKKDKETTEKDNQKYQVENGFEIIERKTFDFYPGERTPTGLEITADDYIDLVAIDGVFTVDGTSGKQVTIRNLKSFPKGGYEGGLSVTGKTKGKGEIIRKRKIA